MKHCRWCAGVITFRSARGWVHDLTASAVCFDLMGRTRVAEPAKTRKP